MSELYKADASKFTREQLLELINHQTELHIEGNVMLIIAKGKIKELEHKLALAIEALESISVKEYHCLCNYTCKEALEKLK